LEPAQGLREFLFVPEHYEAVNGKMTVIAFASLGENIDSDLSPHFGRCPYYVFVELDGSNVKDVWLKRSPFINGHNPGQVPQFIANAGANVIVSGGMGWRAIDWFKQLGVTPITTQPRKIRDILDDYIAGRLQGAESCSESEEHAHGHH